MFEGIDFGKLFSNRPGDPYHQGSLTESRIAEAEKVLGYHFPKSYIEFLQVQNGGTLSEEYSDCYLTAIYGIGSADNSYGIEKKCDLWKNDWQYPDIGIPFGETESGGHDLYYMDFSVVDENGEPRIVLIDNEGNNEVYFVANNFAEFIGKVFRKEDLSGRRIVDETKERQQAIDKELDEINGNLSLCRGLVFFDIIALIIGLMVQNVAVIVICALIALVLIPLCIKLDRKYESVKAGKNKEGN